MTEINQELRQRLSISEHLNNRYLSEIALCQQINEKYSLVVVEIGELKNENEILNDKLKRTRRIGIGATVFSFVGGVVFVLFL